LLCAAYRGGPIWHRISDDFAPAIDRSPERNSEAPCIRIWCGGIQRAQPGPHAVKLPGPRWSFGDHLSEPERNPTALFINLSTFQKSIGEGIKNFKKTMYTGEEDKDKSNQKPELPAN